MVEFAFGGTGRNSHHGAPYNPWDAAAHRSVGGSSSGAGVSLLEGSALLAFGSDTGQLDPVIAPAVRSAENLSAREYLARVSRLGNLARTAAPRLDAIDVIASPTLCLTPPLMTEVADADSHLPVNRRIVRNTAWVNYLSLCAVTMPIGRDRAGLPIGLQLTAPANAEEKLLRIAMAAERVLGTAADRLGTPPMLDG